MSIVFTRGIGGRLAHRIFIPSYSYSSWISPQLISKGAAVAAGAAAGGAVYLAAKQCRQTARCDNTAAAVSEAPSPVPVSSLPPVNAPAAAPGQEPFGTATDSTALSVPQTMVIKFCLGSCFGIFFGHTMRRVGRIVAAFLGINVLMTEVFVLLRWLTIDWRRVGRDLFKRPNCSTLSVTAEGLALTVGIVGGTFLGFHYTRPQPY
ncbi:unnamed protein product [Vitrella brassicaformis CCMP3155]|uniref:Uncharacterized protein n=2 Tax=Vitrella brassicaformis TaxID=1169539 RepID=A0A0G4FUV9_VITBC|nr:unnamed protein product [Vitrella brassicaformis CCMP3155]|eukprot:CEM18379.1 unnamed protein product [Vitrella brassicaformis CCMP3155]